MGQITIFTRGSTLEADMNLHITTNVAGDMGGCNFFFN